MEQIFSDDKCTHSKDEDECFNEEEKNLAKVIAILLLVVLAALLVLLIVCCRYFCNKNKKIVSRSTSRSSTTIRPTLRPSATVLKQQAVLQTHSTDEDQEILHLSVHNSAINNVGSLPTPPPAIYRPPVEELN